MKKILLIFTVTLITFMAQAQAPVVGGNYVDHGDYPWIVSLEAQGDPLCGAVLIAPEWVLTAGHCGAAMPPFIPQADKVHVNLYSRNSINADAETLLVDSIFVHQDYDIYNIEGPDIALIRLKRPSSITPISLVGNNDHSLYATNSKCKVIGWGSINAIGDQSDTLKEANVFITNYDTCKTNYASGANWTLKDFQVCAGYLKDSTEAGAGAGDSGGPLFAWHNNKWVHIGIVSGGNSNITTVDYPGVFTRTIEMRNWIDSVMIANTTFATGNPDISKDQVKLRISNSEIDVLINEESHYIEIQVFNMIGQEITSSAGSGTKATIFIGDLVTGVYITTVRTEKTIYSRKFYKQ